MSRQSPLIATEPPDPAFQVGNDVLRAALDGFVHDHTSLASAPDDWDSPTPATWLPKALRAGSTATEARAAGEHYLRAAIEVEADAEAILCPVLGFLPYEPGSPGYTEGQVNYATGDHVAQSLMQMAADRIRELTAALEKAQAHA